MKGPTMSTTQVQHPPPVRTRRRWRRWVVVALLTVATIGVGGYIYLEFFSDRDLHEAIAEADRLDPGWRFDDMEAARAKLPDDDNGALVVLAARALIPAGWHAPPPNGEPRLADR